MKIFATLAIFSVTQAFLATATPHSKRAAPETIYLANCAASTGQYFSEVDFYNAGHTSTGDPQGNYPDSYVRMATANNQLQGWRKWEGSQQQVTFADSGVTLTWSVDPDAQSKAYFTKVGTAWNKYHVYNCFRDNKREIWYASGGGFAQGCNSIYYCQIA